MEEQTGENMERRRKASYLDDEKANSISGRSSCDDEQKGKAYERRGSHRASESSKKTSDKRKGQYDEGKSRKKTAQRILS